MEITWKRRGLEGSRRREVLDVERWQKRGNHDVFGEVEEEKRRREETFRKEEGRYVTSWCRRKKEEVDWNAIAEDEEKPESHEVEGVTGCGLPEERSD